MSVKAIPDGFRSITPGANLEDAAKAVRGGQVVDPCGNHWFIATHEGDVPHEENIKRMAKLQADKA